MIKDSQDKPYSGLKRYKEKARKTAKELDNNVQRDLKDIGMTWEAQQLAVDRGAWRRSVAQCVFDTG